MPQATRVLLVEDDEDCRDSLADLLQEAGYEVFTASNGRAGLEALEEGVRPHLILLDMMMPVMSGWELLEELDLQPALTQAPVVVISALDEPTSHHRVKAAVQKPMSINRLRVILDALGADFPPPE